MPIRFPVAPTLILSALILTTVCSGCARRNIVWESNRDLMPCEDYGGKVSMAMRAPSALPGEDLKPQGVPFVAPVRAKATAKRRGTSPPPQPRPDPGPMFFAPPSLTRTEEPSVSQTGFEPSAPQDRTLFTSHLAMVPFDPAYDQSPETDPARSGLTSPQLSLESFDEAGPMGGVIPGGPSHRSCLRETWLEAKQNVCSDYAHYYNRDTMARLACGLVLGSVLANTSMDQDVQDWYQQDVRSEDTDNLAEFWKVFGEGHLFIPGYACLAVAGKFVEDWPVVGPMGDFGARTTRAYLVGAPPMLFMQFMLGASRPGETNQGSYWDPFQDTNAVSGHAFIGAVPFLTAARMTDNLALKSGFYACSTLTGLSRVNDNCHYLSQAVLGWWMAYLACEAIDQTQLNRHGVTFMPIASTDSVGFGAIYEY